MSDTVKKIALVGCGRISKRHIEAISENDNIVISHICDIQKDRAEEKGKELGVPFCTDYKEIRGADVIAVLTPSGHHPKHSVEIAHSTDAPFILIEKPISLTLREAAELYKEISALDKTILPVYQNRYNPLVAFMKELIEKGKLGKIYQFNMNVFWNRNDAYFDIGWHGTMDIDGGVLYTQASHYVDMLHFFFGKAKSCKGLGGYLRNLEVMDTVSAAFHFENGTVGSLNATVCTFRENYMTEFTVIGEKGTVRLSGTNLNTIDYWDVQDMEKPDMDFKLDHIYGKGHDTLYKYIAEERFDMFPSKEDVLSGILLMERLSF